MRVWVDSAAFAAVAAAAPADFPLLSVNAVMFLLSLPCALTTFYLRINAQHAQHIHFFAAATGSPKAVSHLSQEMISQEHGAKHRGRFSVAALWHHMADMQITMLSRASKLQACVTVTRSH